MAHARVGAEDPKAHYPNGEYGVAFAKQLASSNPEWVFSFISFLNFNIYKYHRLC